MEGREHSGCLTKGACDRHRYLHPCQTCRLERCMRGGMNPTFTATLKDPGNNPIVRKFRREHDNIQSCSSTASTSSCSLDLVPVPKRSAMPSVIECTIERALQTYAYDTTPLGKPWRPGAWKCWPLADLIFSIEFIKTFECFHCLSHQDKVKVNCRCKTSTFR
ncbi:hypothetical protein PMAYCL1PPCAC_05921 [Pristionchus mayeri]|uniref:Nuclear receptor n=1 Tax=Pristionchus mayeri TaxID=1317129 RepID=A0AAN4ZAY3_9BILA|nr:hypothetical protein PMAYCL1PPCAC_05921 [Pristionchus mayeri]